MFDVINVISVQIVEIDHQRSTKQLQNLVGSEPSFEQVLFHEVITYEIYANDTTCYESEDDS